MWQIDQTLLLSLCLRKPIYYPIGELFLKFIRKDRFLSPVDKHKSLIGDFPYFRFVYFFELSQAGYNSQHHDFYSHKMSKCVYIGIPSTSINSSFEICSKILQGTGIYE